MLTRKDRRGARVDQVGFAWRRGKRLVPAGVPFATPRPAQP